MKKRYFKFGIVAAVLVFAFTACSKEKAPEEDSEEEDMVYEEIDISSLNEYLMIEDSKQTPVLDEETNQIHFQGFVYKLTGEEAEIVNYDWIDSGEVILPSSLVYGDKEYPVTSIGTEAFFYCSEIQKLTIPKSIRTIGVNAFYGCDGITEVILEEGLTKIDNGAFYGCSSLTNITLPEGLLHIGTEAFCSCTALETIQFPDSVKEIGKEAFYGCVAMESITLPASLTSLSEGLFSGCENLSQIQLPEGLTVIENEAFWYCSALTGIELPEKLTHIGNRAFYCAGIVELTLPSGVSGISEDTFDGCDTIKKLYVAEADLSHYKEVFEDSDIEIAVSK